MDSIQSIEDLNRLCHTSCFQIQFEEKTRCQKIVIAFVSQLLPAIADLDKILKENISPTTIFVLSQYLYKQLKDATPDTLSKMIDIYLEEISSRYDQASGKFIRAGVVLENYVVTSIFRLIGEAIKVLARSQSSKEGLLARYTFTNSFELVFWKHLTNTFATADYTIGFLSYRALIYFYQDSGIPLAIKSLIPYFTNLTQTIEFNQLSMLQANMTVNQQRRPEQNPTKFLQFTENQLFIARTLLQLIEEIFLFPYSITYGEYDLDIAYEHAVIYFPESVTQLITESEFYQSLFFLTERFLIQKPEDPLLFVCIDSLKKMVLTRVSFFNKEQRNSFIKRTLIGVTNLMKIPNNQSILIDIIQLNSKMLANIHVKKFRHYPQFIEWFNLLQKLMETLLLSKPFKYHETEFSECFDLIDKLHSAFKHSKLEQYRAGFIEMSSRLLGKVLLKLFSQQQPLTSTIVLERIKQIKTAASEFYSHIKQVVLYNFESSIVMIHQIQTSIFQRLLNNEAVNVNALINLNHLMCEIITPHLVTHAYSSQSSTETAGQKYLKNIIENQMNYIVRHYQEIGAKYQSELLNISTVILIETLLMDFCSNLSAVSKAATPKSKQISQILQAQKKIHKMGGKSKNDFTLTNTSKIFKIIDMDQQNFESFIENYISLLMKHLESGDPKQIGYVLQIISTCILKMKWAIKRVYFKKLPVIKHIVKFCLGVTFNNFQTEALMKSRTEIMKLITILSFDDCLDSYKDRIDSVFNNLSNNNMITLMFDIKGMAEQIDTSSIYRYFLTKATPFLEVILNNICSHYLGTEKVLRVGIKVFEKILSNSLQRINTSNKSFQGIYRLVGLCAPYWNTILNYLETKIDSEDFQQYISSYTHMIECFKNILDGKYINFSILREICPTTDQYVVTNLRFINSILKTTAYQYPKTKKATMSCCKLLLEDLPEFIYGIKDTGDYSIEIYVKLFTNCLKILYEELNDLIANSNDKTNQFGFVIDFLLEALMFQYNALLQKHNVTQYTRACLFKNLIREYILEMMASYLNGYTMMNAKSSKTMMDKLTRFLASIIRLYPQHGINLVKTIQSLIPNSNMELLMNFFESCLVEQKTVWCQNLHIWRESLKPKEPIEVDNMFMM